MNDIVKICKKHGQLTIEQTYIKKRQLPRKNTYICKLCSKLRVDRYIDKNKDRISKQRRDQWCPIKEKDRRLKRLYDISLSDFNTMLEKQNGVCAICFQREASIDKRLKTLRRLSVDHNHATGAIRELICFACNNILGKANDSIQILESAINYLKKHS